MTTRSATRSTVIAGLVAALLGGCGGDGAARSAAEASAAEPEVAWQGRPARRCAGAVSIQDPSRDTRSWGVPEPPGRPPTPPSADLRRFELRASAAGVCARWTTAAPVPPGTTLDLILNGPQEGAVSHAYGFGMLLDKGRARVSGQLDRVLRAEVGVSDETVSVFMRRDELRSPAVGGSRSTPFPIAPSPSRAGS